MWNQYFPGTQKSQIRENTISLQAMLSQSQSGLAVGFARGRSGAPGIARCPTDSEEIAMAQSADEKQQTMQLVKRAIARATAGSPDAMPDTDLLPVQSEWG
jgi:hypothetical protein